MENWTKSQKVLQKILTTKKNGEPIVVDTSRADETRSPEEQVETSIVLINRARVYEISDSLTKLFSQTPNKVRVIELPFEELFLDMKIIFKKHTIHGILIQGNFTKPKPDLYGYDYDIGVVWSKNSKDGTYAGIASTMLYQPDKESEKIDTKKFKGDIGYMLRRIVMNFNDFLEHPDIIISERTRTNQKSRKKRGKIPLPDSSVIKVRGELRIYLDSIRPKKGESNDMGLCYEVAGHWRRFRSPRYVHMQGKKIFIHPFIKGKGIPKRSLRQVEKRRK